MTSTEMHTAIGLILDDPSELRWTSAIKDQALNAAQYRIVKFLPSDLIPELQTSQASLTVPITGYVLSGLTKDMLPGRYVNCNLTALNGVASDLWAGHIFVDDMEMRDQNYYMKGSSEVPISYVFGGNLFVLVDTADYNVTATLYYIGTPDVIADGVTDCELDISRHDMVVEAACAQLLRWEGELMEAAPFEQHVGSELTAEILTFQSEKNRKTWR